VPGEYVEEGVASWYGVPFNGRRTSNGEIYDMHEFTAAHRTLPFNAVVRVTNLRNGKQTQVRINDRGPFVADRVIDLSLSAAEAIEMVGPGTAQVRLEVIAGPSSEKGSFAVQVGAFREQENAQRLKVEMESRNLPVSIVDLRFAERPVLSRACGTRADRGGCKSTCRPVALNRPVDDFRRAPRRIIPCSCDLFVFHHVHAVPVGVGFLCEIFVAPPTKNA
jgi:hypothetical protein